MYDTDTDSDTDDYVHTKRVLGGLGDGAISRHAVNGKNYKIQYKTYSNPRSTSVVNVIDKTVGPKGDWVFRIDGPHHGAEFNHVNINPKISGWKSH